MVNGDRVQRSFKEFPMLDALVRDGKIELHFNSEGYVIHKDSVSQDRFMWSIGVVLAQGYVDSLRDNVKRSKLISYAEENGFRRLRLATFTSRMKRESPISRLIRCVRRWCGNYSRNTPRAAIPSPSW